MLALATVGFFLFGAALVLVGASQPGIEADLGLDLAQSGVLAGALALGIGVGVAGSGPLVDRLPGRPLYAGTALVAAWALWRVDPELGFAPMLGLVALLGVALGLQETLLNAAVARRYGARAARPLLFVHAGVTLGAMLAPLAIERFAGGPDWPLAFHAVAGAELALACGALFVRFPQPAGAAAGERLAAPELLARLQPFLWVGFAYVGIESALTVFAVPYAVGTLGLPEASGRDAIAALWLGLLLGRLALLLRAKDPDARLLLAAGVAGGLVLALGLGARLEALPLVYAATGLVMGFVFPVMIALAAARCPESPGTATGLVAGAGAFGGFAVPWLHGALGDVLGIRAALLLAAPWCAVVALAAARAQRRARA